MARIPPSADVGAVLVRRSPRRVAGLPAALTGPALADAVREHGVEV